MNIIAIELQREALKLSRGKLCRIANVDRSTYGRLVRRPGSGRVSSLMRLQTALNAYALFQRASNPTDSEGEGTSHAA
jgi:transcriptional regulator with XRE-family HTH domain